MATSTFKTLLLIAVASAASEGSAAPQHSASISITSDFAVQMLAAHNGERSRIRSQPLVWDQYLQDQAAKYAKQLADSGSFQHSDPQARGDTGENLWMGTKGAFSVESMVGAWASEKRMFVEGVFPSVSRTRDWAEVGHYTQMVWPTTERLGCALATNGKTDFLVCRYAPAGNVDGVILKAATD